METKPTSCGVSHDRTGSKETARRKRKYLEMVTFFLDYDETGGGTGKTGGGGGSQLKPKKEATQQVRGCEVSRRTEHCLFFSKARRKEGKGEEQGKETGQVGEGKWLCRRELAYLD